MLSKNVVYQVKGAACICSMSWAQTRVAPRMPSSRTGRPSYTSILSSTTSHYDRCKARLLPVCSPILYIEDVLKKKLIYTKFLILQNANRCGKVYASVHTHTVRWSSDLAALSAPRRCYNGALDHTVTPWPRRLTNPQPTPITCCIITLTTTSTGE